jgi:hypothetical protein
VAEELDLSFEEVALLPLAVVVLFLQGAVGFQRGVEGVPPWFYYR